MQIGSHPTTIGKTLFFHTVLYFKNNHRISGKSMSQTLAFSIFLSYMRTFHFIVYQENVNDVDIVTRSSPNVTFTLM